ncbi:MAG: hypothetical protein GTO45_24315 [Candidatus Aminicenantes bacterium]|nr:hypothetical protein [Candidatus Aminicenantes bacterium]NIM81878.1 hypothetical protein [Candidatus Aminicenantes bacterium]NIN21255.1 hypothetical protein [Candidatus Aminicenantes bacterium]NIN45076.1 hypothetical protein [Candidatus Aminicenantes bacterium]NIN87893.1 hypothetical protein [Candidatus Aminicenantes bacterium]
MVKLELPITTCIPLQHPYVYQTVTLTTKSLLKKTAIIEKTDTTHTTDMCSPAMKLSNYFIDFTVCSPLASWPALRDLLQGEGISWQLAVGSWQEEKKCGNEETKKRRNGE